MSNYFLFGMYATFGALTTLLLLVMTYKIIDKIYSWVAQGLGKAKAFDSSKEYPPYTEVMYEGKKMYVRIQEKSTEEDGSEILYTLLLYDVSFKKGDPYIGFSRLSVPKAKE